MKSKSKKSGLNWLYLAIALVIVVIVLDATGIISFPFGAILAQPSMQYLPIEGSSQPPLEVVLKYQISEHEFNYAQNLGFTCDDMKGIYQLDIVGTNLVNGALVWQKHFGMNGNEINISNTWCNGVVQYGGGSRLCSLEGAFDFSSACNEGSGRISNGEFQSFMPKIPVPYDVTVRFYSITKRAEIFPYAVQTGTNMTVLQKTNFNILCPPNSLTDSYEPLNNGYCQRISHESPVVIIETKQPYVSVKFDDNVYGDTGALQPGNEYPQIVITNIPIGTHRMVLLTSSLSESYIQNVNIHGGNNYFYYDFSTDSNVRPTSTPTPTPCPQEVVCGINGVTYQNRCDALLYAGGIQYSGACVIVTSTPTPNPNLGSITFVSTPTNTEIYIDGVYKGITQLTVYDVPIGSRVIVLKKAGYSDETRTYNSVAGVTLLSYIVLTPVSTPTPISTATPTPTTTSPTPTPTIGTTPTPSTSISPTPTPVPPVATGITQTQMLLGALFVVALAGGYYYYERKNK